MHAVTYRFRSELRVRWRAWLALAMLVGAVAGTALLLLAGSRRTASAYERFTSSQAAYDVGVVVSCEPAAPPSGRAEPGCHDAVARLPAVELATTASSFPAFIETLDGRSLQPEDTDACYSGPGVVETLFDVSGRFGTTVNRSRIVAGRAARAGGPEEVVISQDTAQRMDLGPGDRLRIRLFGGDGTDDGVGCMSDPAEWLAPQTVRIVGVQLSPGEVRPPSGQYFQSVRLTPAFVARAGNIRDRSDYLVVRLRAGTSPDALRAQAQKAGYELEVVVSQAEFRRTVERAIRPSEVSLAILAALTALAAFFVLGQVLARQATVESGDDEVLSALGMSTHERVALAVLRGGAVGVAAAALAVAAALAASPLMPIGLARRVEPGLGVSIDLPVLGLGALITVLFVAATSVVSVARPRRQRDRRVNQKRATISSVASRAGFSPAAVSGARFALERGVGSTGVPVASSFAALSIAVMAVVGALTFGAGLTHLREAPRLSGWNWDLMLAVPEIDDSDATSVRQAREVAEKTLSRRDVSDIADGTVWPPFQALHLGPDRQESGGFMAFDGAARVGPSVISGRKPNAADEILIGQRTLSRLGLHVGDRVDVYGSVGEWGEPGRETSTRMRIVGTGLTPMSESLGHGATITLAGLRRLSPGANGGMWFVRLEPGADPNAVIDAFRAAFPGSTRSEVAPFDIDSTVNPTLNLDQVGSVPAFFALIMGLMAAGVLAHVLVVATRARRRELAILRALGFSRGQTLRAIAWQSTIYAIGALAVGLPVGIALGRITWRAYAANLGAVPEPVTPVLACAAVVATALVLALLLSLLPGRRAARTNPSALLRTE